MWRTGASTDGDNDYTYSIDSGRCWMIVAGVAGPVCADVLVTASILDVIAHEIDWH